VVFRKLGLGKKVSVVATVPHGKFPMCTAPHTYLSIGG